MREMKDSGVEWIGEIPSNWGILPLARILAEHSRKNIGNVEQNVLSLSYGNIIRRDVTDNMGLIPESFETYNIIEPGHIVLRLTDLQNDQRSLRTGLVKERGIITSAYLTLTSKLEIDSRYYHYLLHTYDVMKIIYNMGNGVRQNLKFSELAKLPLPIPVIEEQLRIADFLDAKCAQIDRAIARQQEVIEKLKEYKLSVITEAVTKGLNPDVAMKDSGIEWIGEIPEHWGLPSIKRIARLTSGGTPDRGHPEYWNGEIPWIKTGELKNDFIFDAEEYITEMGLQSSSARVFDANTILMAMYGQGKTRGMTGLLKISAATNQACCGITVNNDIVTVDYLWIFLIGSYEAIRAEAAGSGQPNLNAELIYGFHVTVPPLEEQADIYNFLINIGTKIDSAIKKKEQLIDKLTEYKKSLIYEVVTGKREV